MIVPIFIDKKALGRFYKWSESDYEDAQKISEAIRKEKEEKHLKEVKVYEEELNYKRNHPHCTEMFNHFDFGNEWFPVNYRW